jgi:hypothetical protein
MPARRAFVDHRQRLHGVRKWIGQDGLGELTEALEDVPAIGLGIIGSSRSYGVQARDDDLVGTDAVSRLPLTRDSLQG